MKYFITRDETILFGSFSLMQKKKKNKEKLKMNHGNIHVKSNLAQASLKGLTSMSVATGQPCKRPSDLLHNSIDSSRDN